MAKITGLDKFSRKMKEVSSFAREIDGNLGQVSFNASDPGSIDRAIVEMETMIDERAAPYGSNDAIQKIADDLKERYRQMILDKAAAKRLESETE